MRNSNLSCSYCYNAEVCCVLAGTDNPAINLLELYPLSLRLIPGTTRKAKAVAIYALGFVVTVGPSSCSCSTEQQDSISVGGVFGDPTNVC